MGTFRLFENPRALESMLVPKVGLEPTREFTSADFESAASANSATSASHYATPYFAEGIGSSILFPNVTYV